MIPVSDNLFKEKLYTYEEATGKREQILISSNQVEFNSETLTTVLNDLEHKTAGMTPGHSVSEYVSDEMAPVIEDVSDLQTTATTHTEQIQTIDNKLEGIDTTVTDYADKVADVVQTNLDTFTDSVNDSVASADNRITDVEDTLEGITGTVVTHVAQEIKKSDDVLNNRIDTVASDVSIVTSRVDRLETDKIHGIMLDGVLQQVDQDQIATLDLKDYATKADISRVHRYMGSVSFFQDLLNIQNPHLGDTYNVQNAGGTDSKGTAVKAGDNVAYGDNGWDVLAGTTDLSAYLTKADAEATYVTQIPGKQLSTNDLTDELVQKIDNSAAGGIMNISLDNVLQPVASNTATLNLSAYVKKETGKQLSQYNFNDDLNNKLNVASTKAASAVQSIKLDNVVQTVNPDTRQVTLNLNNYATKSHVSDNYVSKIEGKGLSTEDLTTARKDRLEIAVTDISLDNVTQTKDEAGLVTLDLNNYATKNHVSDNYVSKITGKGLSTEDFSTSYKVKLDSSVVAVTLDGKTQSVNNSIVDLDLSDYATKSDIAPLAPASEVSNNFVSKEPGKGLSHNDLTDELVDTISDTAVIASTALQGIILDSMIQAANNNIVDLDLSNYATRDYVQSDFVSKVAGKELSEEDFTTDYKDKLDIAVTSVSLDNVTQAKDDDTVVLDLSNYATKSHVSDNYVSKIPGKQLSVEDFTTAYRNKLDSSVTELSLDNVVQTKTGDTINLDLSNYATKNHVSTSYVQKDGAKILSTNDFTNEYKSSVDTLLSDRVNKIILDNKQQSIQNNTATLDLSDYATKNHVSASYVQKNGNKQLSEEDFTSVHKDKLERLDPYNLAYIQPGVTPGTYGPSSNEITNAVITPQVTVDSHGFITGIQNRVTTISTTPYASSASTANTATIAASQLGVSGNVVTGNSYGSNAGITVKHSVEVATTEGSPRGTLRATDGALFIDSDNGDSQYGTIKMDAALAVTSGSQVTINQLTVSKTLNVDSAYADVTYIGPSSYPNYITRLSWGGTGANNSLAVSNVNGQLNLLQPEGIALSATGRIVVPSLTGSATYAVSAGNATTAANATNATTATTAGTATVSAKYATSAGSATNAGTAANATTAATAGTATVSAKYATSAGSATSAGYATEAKALDDTYVNYSASADSSVETALDNLGLAAGRVKVQSSYDFNLAGTWITVHGTREKMGGGWLDQTEDYTGGDFNRRRYANNKWYGWYKYAPTYYRSGIAKGGWTLTSMFKNAVSAAMYSFSVSAAIASSAITAATAGTATVSAKYATSAGSSTSAGYATNAGTANTASGFTAARTISIVNVVTSNVGSVSWNGSGNVTISMNIPSRTASTLAALDTFERGRFVTNANLLGFTETLHGQQRHFGNLELQELIPYTGWTWVRRTYTNGAWSAWYRYDASRKWNGTAWEIGNAFTNDWKAVMSTVVVPSAAVAASATVATTSAKYATSAGGATSAATAGVATTSAKYATSAGGATSAGVATTSAKYATSAGAATTAGSAGVATTSAKFATTAGTATVSAKFATSANGATSAGTAASATLATEAHYQVRTSKGNSTDLNSITTPGVYRIGASPSNAPSNVGTAYPHTLVVLGAPACQGYTAYCLHFFFNRNTNTLWFRAQYSTTTFTAWKRFTFE